MFSASLAGVNLCVLTDMCSASLAGVNLCELTDACSEQDAHIHAAHTVGMIQQICMRT